MKNWIFYFKFNSMKELIKPNVEVEQKYDVSYFCETNCDSSCGFVTPRRGVANRGCSGGATNNSIGENDEIIF